MSLNLGSLKNYLQATSKVSSAHADTPPKLMHLVNKMEELFQQEVFVSMEDKHAFDTLLSMNAYTLWLSSVRQVLSGHSVSVFPVLRTALESACYALLISGDEKNASVWGDRNKSNSASGRCRKEFTASKATKKLCLINAEMAKYTDDLYEALIDFGAHPNQRSILSRVQMEALPDGRGLLRMSTVYEAYSWEINCGLFLCVEAGLAIAFIIAAGVPEHPLHGSRIGAFQEMMDLKNSSIKDLEG